MDKDTEKIHLIEFLLGNYSFCDVRFETCLIKTLIRLPKEDLEFFANKKNVMIIQPPANSFYEFDPMTTGQNIVLIIFTSDILNSSPDGITYIIAHEFAHVYLGHPPLTNNIDIEIEADKQVIKWGFEKELKNTDFNYIYAKELPKHLKLCEAYNKQLKDSKKEGRGL